MEKTPLAATRTRPPHVHERRQDAKRGISSRPHYNPTPNISHHLAGKTVLIAGGDCETREALALMFAREAAKLAMIYPNDDRQVKAAARRLADGGGQCLTIAGDIADAAFCKDAVAKVIAAFGKVDILVNCGNNRNIHKNE